MRPMSSARRYLDARARFGMKFGLETMRALLDALGHPERAAPALLVAGTNGKGSVVAYVDQGLRASGLRVGRYTSPHLVRVNERIVVDGREITDAQLERAVDRVRRAAEVLVRAERIPAHPTHFEVVTAAAFVHFAARRVDVAVLEVGLGGRLDATNVSEPIASAIVTIARDHEAQLGSRLDAIAREKAGVVRRGRVTVLGALPRSARAAVARAARERGARLRDALAEGALREHADGLEVRTRERVYRGLRPLPGAHQQANLRVALALLEEARAAGLPVDLSRVSSAIGRTRWDGRLQTLPGRPPLLLDGAHNPEGARALALHLRGLGPFVLVFGAMADKDVAGMAGPLFPLAQAVVLTRVAQPRAAAPRALARRIGPLARGARQEPTVARALARARALAGPGGRVVVAGSLFLVGEVLALRQRSAAAGGSRIRRPR
jgi:dihydrofolate synthase/folylpolyglutamate synthase